MSTASVLIVDDDPRFLDAVVLFLQKHGCRAFQAPSGREGLRLLETENVDVAVIDVHLPDLSGLEVVDNVLRMTHPPVIILISGDDSPETEELCRQCHVAKVLLKPIPPRELLQIIEGSVRASN